MIYLAIDRWSSSDSYLAHHGVKGMKWGVRKTIERIGRLRNRNPNKLTYRRYSKEKDAEYHKAYNKYAESEGLRKIQKQSYDLATKYGLDMDDGGGGDTSKYSEKQLHKAGRQYWDLAEKEYDISEKVSEKAGQEATRVMNKRYGKTKIDILKRNHSNAVQAGTLAVLALGIGAYAYSNNRRNRRSAAKWEQDHIDRYFRKK